MVVNSYQRIIFAVYSLLIFIQSLYIPFDIRAAKITDTGIIHYIVKKTVYKFTWYETNILIDKVWVKLNIINYKLLIFQLIITTILLISALFIASGVKTNEKP